MGTFLRNLTVFVAASGLFVLYGAPVVLGQENIDINNQTAGVGESVTFTVSVNNAPALTGEGRDPNLAAEALGFEVLFDPNVLEFTGFTRGDLTTAWTAFDVNEVEAGRVRVGGFTQSTEDDQGDSLLPITVIIDGEEVVFETLDQEASVPEGALQEGPSAAIEAGGSGSLVQLTFNVIGAGNTTLTINRRGDPEDPATDFSDDISSWTSGQGVCCGVGDGVTLDIDVNNSLDGLTDGLLCARFIFGFTDQLLINNAVGADCTRCTAADIQAAFGQLNLDIDGNAGVDGLTDGLLCARFIFGFTGQLLINNAVGGDCTRCTAPEIEGYLQSISPQ